MQLVFEVNEKKIDAKMKPCLCYRLYNISVSAPTAIIQYVFSGSLCRIRKFETFDGLRHCITIFSLSDYKRLHFPHNEYKHIISKLYTLLSTQTILPSNINTSNSSVQFNIRQPPFDGDFKMKFGGQCFTIGPVTAFGILNTTPFTDFDVSSVNKNHLTCDSKWDICVCETCPVFTRMCDFEASAREIFPHRKTVNIVFSNPDPDSGKTIMAPKRTYEDAFKQKPLQDFEIGDFYVEHTVFKVIEQINPDSIQIKTMQKSTFDYGVDVIKETATSATLYSRVKKTKKAQLIELFNVLSMNDIWHATFFEQNNDDKWQEDLVAKIRSLGRKDASKYVKRNFATFGNTLKELSGQKLALKSNNNCYEVRDLNIYFNELDANGAEMASKKSVRKLDVNTLQSLIFNGVKYVLKN